MPKLNIPHSKFYLVIALLIFGICFDSSNVSAQTVSVKTLDKANYEIYCKDENLRTVWKELKNEFKKITAEDLTKISTNNCGNLFEVKQVKDLNGDGLKEIIIHKRVDCSATINCAFWIFEKRKDKYQAIFEGREIERFALEKTQANGYPDIQLRTHNTGTSHYFRLLRFNGKKYKPQKCWQEDYAVPDKKGNFYILEKPQIRFVKCGE